MEVANFQEIVAKTVQPVECKLDVVAGQYLPETGMLYLPMMRIGAGGNTSVIREVELVKVKDEPLIFEVFNFIQETEGEEETEGEMEFTNEEGSMEPAP